MRNKSTTSTEKEILYPIIPIHLPSFLNTDSDASSSSETESQHSTSTTSTSEQYRYLTRFIHALETGILPHANLPPQTQEILEQLHDPRSKVEIRTLKKTAYTYRSIPRKVRESILMQRPASLGTACGIGKYGIMRIYVFEEDYETALKCGFHKGDMILDARTRTPSELSSRVDKKGCTELQEDERAVGFILPVETHCVPERMYQALSDFIQISLLPLSVPAARSVESNRAGGLVAKPKWRGVVVSREIREALAAPSGWIVRCLKEKWGVSVAVEDSPYFPEEVENKGMVLISRISW